VFFDGTSEKGTIVSNLHLSGNQIVETIAGLGDRTTMNNS